MRNVQIYGGFVIHIGSLTEGAGRFSVGEEVICKVSSAVLQSSFVSLFLHFLFFCNSFMCFYTCRLTMIGESLLPLIIPAHIC